MKYALTSALFLSGISAVATGQNKPSKYDSRPNIVLIMADDLGYSDIGAYGSEIKTPNLDKLASQGVRFREFYNNSISAPTRASLITGQYSHKAGVGYFDTNLGLPAYQGYLNRESVTFAEVLKGAGYSTLMSGKWHVGNDSLSWPNQRGFEKYYGIIGGASNYFDTDSLPFGDKPYPVALVKNNVRQHPKPNSYYFTNEIAANAVEFLDEQNKTDKPFFLYVAFNAPHWPLQALPEDIAKYKGRYDIGWDSLRTERIARQKQLGILLPGQVVSKRDPEVPYWNKLTYEEQQFWKRKEEVFAAMIDNMDQNIGKILAKIKEQGKEDNTIVIFLSDNGSQGGFSSTHLLNRGQVKNAGPIGTAGSFEYLEQPWAAVGNTPFRQYKNNMHEGGFRAPFIVRFPNKIKNGGTIVKGTGHIIDLAPTFYELAKASYPTKYNGNAINPLPGKSLLPVLEGKTEVVNREGALFWERAGNRAVRKGDWKLVSTFPAYEWELYNIAKDAGETTNLAAEYPRVVDELAADYFSWAKKTDVVDYNTIKPQGGFLIPGQTK
jgi:arylsulfatase A-like enzyme